MKATLMSVTLALVLVGVVAVPAVQAKRPKHSFAHDAAVQKCGAAYEAAAAAAHAPSSPKGKARMQAMHAAAEAKKACVAKAPK